MPIPARSYSVSILAPLARGALLDAALLRGRDCRCFNPRPSRKRGATCAAGSAHGTKFLFQSSPLSQEGRYVACSDHSHAAKTFQSSPLSQEGRYISRDAIRASPSGVSILAPLARGALQVDMRKIHDIKAVSILAPLARGALPAQPVVRTAQNFCFNPRPSRKRGAT